MLKYLPFIVAISLGAFNLQSPAFPSGGEIPPEHGCEGNSTSPELVWSDAPINTQAYALVVTDLTIDKVHGRLYNISRETNRLEEGALHFLPFCPPKGETHTYEFALYALDTKIKLDRELEPRTIEVAKLIGTYGRASKPAPPVRLERQ